ncbi:hypothetical protein [Mucilaginibacter sp. FT3.2]|uniref:hypothetical protein n=1 Tax=Mucilaginibacter sp. FT3.2 TaxID=2723090 RepID=UPI00161C85FD|nr:hypothetical protein [Mucilaginibacter sp. FT3.2]MBB6232728.1 hypothetical protein [Mucilaginibacter sp. FT3.2]
MKNVTKFAIAAIAVVGIGFASVSAFAVTRVYGTSYHDGKIHSCEGAASNCSYEAPAN